jgi:hypothetical protein
MKIDQNLRNTKRREIVTIYRGHQILSCGILIPSAGKQATRGRFELVQSRGRKELVRHI